MVLWVGLFGVTGSCNAIVSLSEGGQRCVKNCQQTSKPKLPVTEHNVSPDHTINMDEVPLTFKIPIGRSVAEKGRKSVNIVATGHEKSFFTVVLVCCGDGSKLPPMVIFKQKTMPKDNCRRCDRDG